MKIKFSILVAMLAVMSLWAVTLVNAQPPDIPSSFYGEVHFMDNAPAAGDTIDVYIETYPGTPAISTQIFLESEVLKYTVNVPGDAVADAGKDVIFVIGTRIAAIGVFDTNANQQIHLHPPQAVSGGPYSGAVNSSISFSASANDFGSDVSAYEWDWNNDGTYDETGQNVTHSWDSIGSKTVNLKVTDAQEGEGTASFTVSVTAVTASVEITNLNQVYGSVVAPTVITTPLGLSYSITYDSSPTLPTNAGSYAVEVIITDPDYTGSGSGTLVIDKAATTTTVTGGTFTYDGSAHPATVTVTGAGGLSLTPDPVYSGTCTTAPVDVTTPDCSASYTFAEQANYYGSSDTDTIVINPKTASVSPNAASKTYGEADPVFSGTLAGFIAGDGISATYNRTSGENVAGSPYTISATLTPSEKLGNYSITYNTASFTINPKSASVTPDADSKTYGSSDPVFTGTLTGFLEADGITPTYSRTTGETVAGSPYTISAVLAPSEKLGNYSITYNTASFTINPKAASVTPNSASKVVGESDPVLSGSLVGFLAGDNVAANYSRTTGETPGTYTISAELTPTGVLGNYSITYNTAVFTIHAKHSISLVTGWNLISFNLVPLNSAIEDVLSSIDGNYSLVYAWDAAADGWLIYDPVETNTDTLTTLTNSIGFWIYMDTADTLDVIGTQPVSTTINLAPGWNLVGYPSDHGVTPASTGNTFIYAYHAVDTDSWKLYDALAPAYANDLTSIQPGWGYWILVSASDTWDVTY